MKIIYDISMLGAGRSKSQPRGGIFRVVENVAYGLVGRENCRLIFSATNNTVESLEYLRHNPTLGQTPFSSTVLKRFLGRNKLLFKELLRLEANNGYSNGTKPMPVSSGILRKWVGPAYRAFESCFDPIRTENLAQTEIFHSTFYMIPPQIRRFKKIKKFLTIYDLIPVLYPAFCPLDMQELSHVLNSVEKKDYIFCISQSTKNDLCDYLKIDASRIFVTYPAASEDLFYPCTDAQKIAGVRRKYGIPNAPYLLCLGRLESRKNINHSIRCFSRLVQQEKINDLYFVLVGAEGWQSENIFREVEHYSVLKDRILFTGYVEDQDLAPLYSGALAFIYPSFYEGFGLPPLEAMQCGVPVITSNTSSFPEVMGDAGILVEPSNADALCQGILEIYKDSSLRESLSRKSIQQAKKFNWKKTTEDIIQAYQVALSE